MLYAIDVSHHQNPARLNWDLMRRAGCDLCIVRLTYGTKKDALAKEHVRLARENGFAIGAYAFARFVQPAKDQFQAFVEAADEVGYGREEDVIPALDIEDDTQARPILPEHAPFFEEFAGYFKGWKSRGCYAYITQRDWGRLGKPLWVLELPLFVAHYAKPSRLEPATPNGMPWSIWQHRVGPFHMNGPSGYDAAAPLLDQSRVRKLHFFNGEEMVFEDERDEELRHSPDEAGTEAARLARHEEWTRVFAQGGDLLETDRGRKFRSEMDTLDDPPPGSEAPSGEKNS